MPYVPSVKTDGTSQDRNILDAAVELAAAEATKKITNNFSLTEVYKDVFLSVAKWQFTRPLEDQVPKDKKGMFALAMAIHSTGESYGYEGAFLGELNYAITRFIQRVPQMKVADESWLPKDEIRYWLYAATIGALLSVEAQVRSVGIAASDNIAAVFHDIKDEYKWRVNRSYEAAQIVKSGDCYDAPFYSRLMEVVDESGTLLGHVDVYLARSEETLGVDVLNGQLVFKKKPTA